MTKFYGKIGFSSTEQTVPGVWTPGIVEKQYYGDVLTNSRRYEAQSSSTNDNLLINHKISILADTYFTDHIGNIIFVEFGGSCWKVNNIEIQYPRLILTLGGVYNGERAT